MKELEEDEFETFIEIEPSTEKTLDIQKMLQAVLKGGYGLRPADFWEMPLNSVLDLLGMFVSPEKKPMSRKVLIDKERALNQEYGIC